MPRPLFIDILDWTRSPLDLIAAWPLDRPLLLLHSGMTDGERDGASPADRRRPRPRWSIFASPRRWVTIDAGATGGNVLAEFDNAIETTRSDHAGVTCPGFAGGWIGFISYELGSIIEPAAQDPRVASKPRTWPALQFGWCPTALVHDADTGRWYDVGDASGSLDLDPAPGAADPATPRTGPWTSSLDPDAYCNAITRTLDFIGAGDIFQANVTQRLRARFRGSTRALARTALERSRPLYGAYLELPGGRCIVSMSPELMLATSPDTRRVITRPIKGTRPSTAPAAELLASEKDAAELNMIIDLMRNDLGRVRTFGSVRVPRGREIETHPTVHHGVAEIEGRLRDDVTVGDLLRATFPAGSVTGAPKIRAMQIIDELETVERGPYCGAIGFIDDRGAMQMNVGIRTMCLRGRRAPDRFDLLDGTLDYGVGGGIVADSDPVEEYRECMTKAAVLELAMGRAESMAAL